MFETVTNVYLDNSATTAVCRSAAQAAYDMMTQNYGNPSSLHAKGLEAEKEITKARHSIAKLLCAEKSEIYFTSGGTEANNLAVFGAVNARRRMGNRIVTTAIEHSSVYESCRELERQGYDVVFLKPENGGCVTQEQIFEAVDSKTILISIMLVNNETGAIQPVETARKAAVQKRAPALIHCDAVQAFGKIPVLPRRLNVDLLTVSAHKIHGPKGVGALYVKNGVRITPRTFGGEQENRLRPGTEAAPLIAGFGAAVREIDLNDIEQVRSLRDYCAGQVSTLERTVLHSDERCLPYIINFSVLGIKSETMLHFLASKGIYVSSGSACAKGKKSHVLSALGLSAEESDSALRVSFSKYNTRADVDCLIVAIQQGMNTLVRR